MNFIDLMKIISLNTQIELYYDDCEYVNEGTAELIRKIYAWEWDFVTQEIERISINEQSKALMITLKRNAKFIRE